MLETWLISKGKEGRHQAAGRSQRNPGECMSRHKGVYAGKDRDAHGAEVAQDAQDTRGTQEAKIGPQAGPAKEHLLPALL